MFNIKAWLGRATARPLHQSSTMPQAAMLLNQGVSPRTLAVMCQITLHSKEKKADREGATTLEEDRDDFALLLLTGLFETAKTPEELAAYRAAFAARYATLMVERPTVYGVVHEPDYRHLRLVPKAPAPTSSSER